MPETPAQNLVVSPSSESPDDRAEEDAGGIVTFLPPIVSRILIAGWVLLFAGRWLVVQSMDAAGLLAPGLVESIDNGLGRCYLLLLSVTLVTLVVRIVRGRSSQPDPVNSKLDFNAQEGSASAVKDTVGAESSDREANRRD